MVNHLSRQGKAVNPTFTPPVVPGQRQRIDKEPIKKGQRSDGSSRQFVRADVLKYIEGGAGEIVYLKDMLNDLGINRASTVQAAIKKLMETIPQIEVAIPGRAWTWHQNGAIAQEDSGKRLFEEIGTSKTGALIIQDADGNLYRAEAL